MYKGLLPEHVLKKEIAIVQTSVSAKWAANEAVKEGIPALNSLTDADLLVLKKLNGLNGSCENFTEPPISAYEKTVLRHMRERDRADEALAEQAEEHRLAKPLYAEGKDDQLTPEEKHKALEELKAILAQTDDAFPQYRPPTADPDDQCLLDLGLGT